MELRLLIFFNRYSLFRNYVFGLEPFLALGYFHGYGLTFIEGFVPVNLNGCMMYEYILSVFLFNKAEAFFIIEPFYFS